MAQPSSIKTVCTNRRARHDFEILEKIEAGLVLAGSEVKSLREGKGNVSEAYVRIRNGDATLVNFEIGAYSHDQSGDVTPRRTRRLLLHMREIVRLEALVQTKGLALVPLSVYFRGPWAKVEVGVGRGRKAYDKRQAIKKREARREMDRHMHRR